ncbi:ArnT family glycosyltransferase [Bordetella genomosp. 11]|uniref:Uncharacterized protein n=1 Tax=Bordetella genomosp. 11 TaxID=1416808 RepID=A0A261UMU3_9BORD|nr:glycosyltransferase family 39 protein [Bordetella genomosp. 11]OZI62965.1 hypothetical protein CAL28_28025 [Bordetella genomosp. 11]
MGVLTASYWIPQLNTGAFNENSSPSGSPDRGQLGGSSRSVSAADGIAWVIFAFALCQFLFFTMRTLNQPIVDMWGFRPAQTAISVQYMLKGLGWFDNIVPVFGEPWSVPLEFPLYQWCVTGLVWLTGSSIDACGRVISAFFTIVVLWPIWMFAKDTLGQKGRRVALLVGAIWLLSPVVVFWGRSFLMETMSVFLAACWLVFYVRFLRTRRLSCYVACAAFGMLAAAVKVTTFAGFAVAGFMYTCVYLWEVRHDISRHIVKVLIAGSSVALSAIALFAWNSHTNSILVQNPISATITVSSNPGWYFGSWHDRVSKELWDWTIRLRELPEALGNGWWVLGIPLLYLTFTSVRFAVVAAMALISYLSVYLMFPRLHMYNGYYQVENVIFLCVAAVAVIEAFLRRKQTFLACAALVVVVGSQISGLYGGHYGPLLFDDLHKHPYYEAGLEVKEVTPPDSVIVVFGTGWGADLPYFAERRGLVLTSPFASPALVRRMLFEERSRWLGGRKIGAVIDCAVFENQRIDPGLKPILEELKQEMGGRVIQVSGSFHGASVNPPECTIYLPR